MGELGVREFDPIQFLVGGVFLFSALDASRFRHNCVMGLAGVTASLNRPDIEAAIVVWNSNISMSDLRLSASA